MPDPNNLPTCECIAGAAPSISDLLAHIYCATLAGGVGGLDIGNMLFVDAENGSDSNSGNLGAALQTLSAAKAAASAGDTIRVFPGSYTVTESLAKDGVNWDFAPGSTVTKSNDSDVIGIWDDADAQMSYAVRGFGTFLRTFTSSGINKTRCVYVGHVSSIVDIEAAQISCSGAGLGKRPVTVYQVNGTMKVAARSIIAISVNTTGGAVVWWSNGKGFIQANEILGTKAIGVYCDVTAAPTGEFYVNADNIEVTNGTGVWTECSVDARIWVTAHTIRGTDSVDFYGLEKCYVTAQKLYGQVYIFGAATGELYVKADKISAIANGSLAVECGLYTAHLHTGPATYTVRLDILHWDEAGFTGDMIGIEAGTTYLQGFDFTAGASTTGIKQTGGTLIANALRINTAANNATSPITKSGTSVLKLNGVILIAEGTQDSISAPTAQNVVAMNSWANKAVDADVTITTGATGLQVDADVS